jgi:hypothetical protein
MVAREKGVPYIWSDCKLHHVGSGRRIEGMVAILNDNELSEMQLGEVRVFGGKAVRFLLMPDDDEVEEEEEDADEVGVDPEDLVVFAVRMRRAA